MAQNCPRTDSEAIQETADLFKRLGHPSRLAIVRHLLDGERSVGEIEADLGLTQPSLSQQLTELRKAGIITPRRQHKHVFYSLSDPRVERVLALFAGKPAASTPARRDWPPMAPLSAAVFARVGPEAVQDRSEPAE